MSKELEKIKKEYSDFAYIVSHDLGAPIRQVRGFFDLFVSEADVLSEDQKAYSKIMSESLDQADEILSSLLNFSRLNTHQVTIENIDLGAFFKQLEDQYNFINIDESLSGVLNLDIVLFEKIITEVFENSKKFKKQGEPLNVDISSDVSNDEVIISVADNGIGIDEEYCEDVFEPMRMLHPKNKYSGCGMGLTLCRKMMGMMNGHIWAQPNHSGGTIIFLKFMGNK